MLHFYWVAGGKWWLDKSLPMNSNQVITYPSRGLTFIVAIGLFFFATIIACFSKLIDCPLPNWVSKIVVYGLAVIFFLRTLGDFKYVGFFRKIKNTTFAHYDALIYTPLSLTLCLLSILLIINN